MIVQTATFKTEHIKGSLEVFGSKKCLHKVRIANNGAVYLEQYFLLDKLDYGNEFIRNFFGLIYQKSSIAIKHSTLKVYLDIYNKVINSDFIIEPLV